MIYYSHFLGSPQQRERGEFEADHPSKERGRRGGVSENIIEVILSLEYLGNFDSHLGNLPKLVPEGNYSRMPL
jgi:hypothetical protein